MIISITYEVIEHKVMTPGLEKKQKSIKEKKTKKLKSKAKAKRNDLLRIRCPICFNNLAKDNVVSTKCGHVFCRNCLQKALSVKPLCPMCRRRLTGYQAFHALYLDENIYEDFTDDLTK